MLQVAIKVLQLGQVVVFPLQHVRATAHGSYADYIGMRRVPLDSPDTAAKIYRSAWLPHVPVIEYLLGGVMTAVVMRACARLAPGPMA